MERPASVVKELVENSIDAGATNIQINIRGAGRKLIAVTDDGVGMGEDDLVMAFKRHTTSKIRSEEDLHSIITMGFRGEALAAIAAVSRIEAISRPEGEELGTYLYLEGGEIIEKKKTGAPVGTTVKVMDLFFNTPARAKFLKSDHTEMQHINAWVTDEALARPYIRFLLTHEGETVISTPGKGKLLHTVLSIFGRQVASGMLEVDTPGDGVVKRIYGLAGKPSLKRSTPAMLHFYINRRPVRSSELTNAVLDAYGNLIPRGYYPVGFLFIDMDPAFVDVNVHPAKVEVKFRRPREVLKGIEEAVGEALKSEPLTAVSKARTVKPGVAPGDRATPDKAERPSTGRDQTLIEYGVEPQKSDVKSIARFSGEIADGEVKAETPEMRLIGQLKASYILCEVEEGLAIIDQHALHERIRYYQLKTTSDRLKAVAQELIAPYIIKLSPQVVAAIERYRGMLEEMGLFLELFGRNMVKVTAVPAVMEWTMTEDDVHAMLDELAEEGRITEDTDIREKAVRLMACKSAIKANTPLTREQMESLLEQMKHVETPYACAHGRPTMIILPIGRIEHDFERS